MAELDGSIRIGVVFDDKKISTEMGKLDQKLSKQNQGIAQQREKVKQLEAQYAQLASREVEPKSLRRMEADLKKVQAEAAKLDEEFQRVSQLAEIEKQAGGKVSPETQGQLDDITEKLTYADQRADALQARIREIKFDPALSDEARKLASELDQAQTKMDSFQREAQSTEQAQAALKQESDNLRQVASGADVADQRIVDLNRELAELTARMKEMKSAGVGLGYEEYDKAAARVSEINAELKEYRRNLETMPDPGVSKWNRLTQALKSGFTRTVNAASGSARKLGRQIQSIGKNRGFDKAAKGAQRLGDRLKGIVAGALVFNVISRGLTALTDQIGKYLTANKDFSDALSGIKSNLLTAFQPVYEAVIPALTSLMQALERVTAQFAAFMATIFGTTAKQAQDNAEALYDQANATKETGDAAKKAEKEQKKYLASFDTIEKLGEVEIKTEVETKKDEVEAQKPQFDTDFEQVTVPQWLLDFWKVFQDSWNEYGATTIQAFKDAVGAIGVAVTAIGTAFMAVWTGGDGLALLGAFYTLLQEILGIIHDIAVSFTLVWTSGVGESILHNLLTLLQTILAQIHAIASAFREAWNSGTGQEVISAILNAINSVLELLISVRQAFIDAWNDNGRGVEICNTILQIIRNIFEFVGNLAERFREAWEANDNGAAIWGAILDIIGIVLSTIERITDVTADWAAQINFGPLVESIKNLLEAMAPVIQIIGDTLAEMWENTVLPFLTWVIETALPAVINKLADLMNWLAQNKEVVKLVTQAVVAFVAAWTLMKVIGSIQALIAAFNPMTLAIQAAIAAVILLIMNWEKVKETVANVIDSIVGFIQKAIDAVKDFFSALGGGGGKTAADYGGYGGSGRSYSPAPAYTSEFSAYSLNNLPHLAQGAVISPNSEFLAVLGDQRNGTNVEAPLGLIEQALDNVLARQGGGGGNTEVTVNFTGSLAQLARLLQPEIKVEQGRLGANLVGG